MHMDLDCGSDDILECCDAGSASCRAVACCETSFTIQAFLQSEEYSCASTSDIKFCAFDKVNLADSILEIE